MKDMAEQGKAKADLIAWLSSPYELGHPPAQPQVKQTGNAGFMSIPDGLNEEMPFN